LALAAPHLRTEADRLRLTKLTGDASTRAYFRAWDESEGASVVLALYREPFDEFESATQRLSRLEAENPSARLTFANDPCAHIEVTRLLLAAGLPVPRVLEARGADGVLVFEDVGDTRLQDLLVDCRPDELLDAYQRALSMIVTIQNASAQAVSQRWICSRLAFDEAKLGWEMDFFFDNFFGRYLGLALEHTRAKLIRREFAGMCSELAARPRVLTHRDYHARNLMLHGEEMFVIDHQDARLGPVSYDVTSLLNDPYARLNSEVRSELIKYFERACAESPLVSFSADEFRNEFELMTVQRTLKAVGTYSYQCAVNRNQVYVQYIEPALRSALGSMDLLGRFNHTRHLIEETLNGRHAAERGANSPSQTA
jgi:hypothetical protein